MGRQRKPKEPKAKAVSYELIARDGPYASMYGLLGKLVLKHHEHLADARICLAWCTSWKPDVDGRLTLGKCRKASDLDRELYEYDFIILLLKSFWTDLLVNDTQRAALLDHELCHAARKRNAETGEPEVDERGRAVWRLRKHDVEEFAFVVSEYGCYKRDLERFEQALRRGKNAPLLEQVDRAIQAEQAKGNGAGAKGIVDAVIDGVASQSTEAGRTFTKTMQRLAKKDGGSVTLSSGGRSVTIDKNGVRPGA